MYPWKIFYPLIYAPVGLPLGEIFTNLKRLFVNWKGLGRSDICKIL